jgi:hypothetical protein
MICLWEQGHDGDRIAFEIRTHSSTIPDRDVRQFKPLFLFA